VNEVHRPQRWLLGLGRVAALAHAGWVAPRAPGKWSPSQIVEYVVGACESAIHMTAGCPASAATTIWRPYATWAPMGGIPTLKRLIFLGRVRRPVLSRTPACRDLADRVDESMLEHRAAMATLDDPVNTRTTSRSLRGGRQSECSLDATEAAGGCRHNSLAAEECACT